MNHSKINSIEELRIHKYQVKKELGVYEDKLKNDYYKLTHPFESYLSLNGNDKKLSLEGILNIISVARKIINITKTGIAIYKSYRHCK